MARSHFLLLLLSSCFIIVAQCQSTSSVRLNHIQVLHAHNSYHACPLPNMQQLFSSPLGQQVGTRLGPGNSPDLWLYGKPSLLELVKTYKVRSLEIDLQYDPTGGRYRYRAGPKLAASLAATNNTGQDGGPDFATPGWKVGHVLDFDFQTTCNTLAKCLRPLVSWSKSNPKHTPLFFNLELKTQDPFQYITAADTSLVTAFLAGNAPPTNLSTTPTPAASHLQALEKEVLSVVDKSRIFTPDLLRGSHSSLSARIKTRGWPTVSSLRGKFIFKITQGAYTGLQKQLWPGSKKSLFFVEAFYSGKTITDPNTVFATTDLSFIRDLKSPAVTAIPKGATIDKFQTVAVAAAYQSALTQFIRPGVIMLRASADEPITQAKTNFRTFANAVLSSGAHFVHTDYPNGWTSTCGFTSSYTVPLNQVKRSSAALSTQLTNTALQRVPKTRLAAVCNVVTAQQECTSWPGVRTSAPANCICYSGL